ncbi:uncharacterized protein LOC129806600 [Phlebotomus papatasi]|uniref:uncharacterized protein LOC129806600 n=1 Tax=Phlebotomus papatasi TaxID=29031 RepID=UPI002483E603|nr:uncharacterized protein LOC129806600 [Phlebotomus papatasi]
MSRKYNKQRFINFLEQEAICDLLDVNEEEERTGQVRDDLMEAAIDRLMEGLLIMITHRYLYRTRVPKSSAWYERILPQYDPSRFLQMLRVSREEFDFILNEITDDLVFTEATVILHLLQKLLLCWELEMVELWTRSLNECSRPFYD